MPDASLSSFCVIRTPALNSLVSNYKRAHRKLDRDLEWLTEKLVCAPLHIGERVPGLQNLAHPIFKTRCKDGCHRIGQPGGWRIYYAVDREATKVWLLFIYHKKESKAPSLRLLLEKIEHALESGP